MQAIDNPNNRLERIYLFIELIALIFASLMFVHYCLDIEFVQDDAYTLFRYAKNFAEGEGLVFNAGEYVEGYTSFLFVIILAGAIKTGLDPVIPAQIISIFFGVLCLWATWIISRELISRQTENYIIKFIFSLLPVILLLFTGGMHYWSVSGMEFSMFIFFVLVSIYIAIRNKNKTSLPLALLLLLATLTRPEGMVFFVLIYLYRIPSLITDQNNSVEWSRTLYALKIIRAELLIYLLPVIAYIIFRFNYYGYPLPNTFFAKTGFSLYYLDRGARYVIDSLFETTILGIIFIFPFTIFFHKIPDQDKIFLLEISLVYLLLVLGIGGDVLPQYRFILPVLPLLFALFSAVLLYTIKNSTLYKNRLIRYLTISLTIVLTIFYSYINYTDQRAEIYRNVSYEKGLVEKMKIYAEWVNRQSAKQDREITVCLATIGAFSYYCNARIIDIIGLTDKYIALNPKEIKGIVDFAPVDWDERRYNVDYVLQQKPDYILFPAGAKPSAYPLVALFSRLEFLNTYYPQLFYSDRLNQHLPIFTRREGDNNLYRESVDQEECSVKFTRPYINANNRLLRYVKTGEAELLDSIKSDYYKVLDYCPAVETEAKTILGIAYFHADSLTAARRLLEEAVALDEMNCIAHVYLVNLYNETGLIKERNRHIRMLNKYSPDALGQSWMKE